MILKTLSLKNFRKFKDAAIEFPDGVTGVVGLNGVGKSTIFEALSWVLYGSVAARTPADQIKRQDALTTDPCRVELEFMFEDDNYRIVREMKGKSLTASATATINGKIAATSAESVSQFVQKKLGMDFKSFFTSIFAKQKELNALSTMIASERRPLILKMLGIDSLDEVIKEIKADKREKDTLLDRLNRELLDTNGNEKIDTYNTGIKQYEGQKKEIDAGIKTTKARIVATAKELKALEKIYLGHKKAFEKSNEQKEKLAEKKTRFEQKKTLEEEIKKLQQKLTERQKTIEKEKKKRDVFKNVDADIESTKKRLDETNTHLEQCVKTIEKKKTLSARITQDIQDIESKKKNIEKLGPNAKCPTCERILSDQHNVLLQKFEVEKKALEKEQKTLLHECTKEQEKKDTLSREQYALQKKNVYLQNQLREKERIDTTIENLSQEIKREQAEIDAKESERKKIGTVVFDLKEFEQVKQQLETLYANYQTSLDTFSKKKDELAALQLQLEKQEGKQTLLSQTIKNIQEKLSQLRDYKKQITDEKKTVRYLGMLNEVMASFRTHLISRIRPTLSSYSSDFFERLTDGKYRELELDENYNLMVYDNGNAYGIERFSGGEEDLANLCLRLAISEVITERAGGVFNFIILDEIFGSQDMFRRQNIMKALNTLSSKFRQIFLITHVNDVKEDMEHIIFVTENEDGTSSIKLE